MTQRVVPVTVLEDGKLVDKEIVYTIPPAPRCSCGAYVSREGQECDRCYSIRTGFWR